MKFKGVLISSIGLLLVLIAVYTPLDFTESRTVKTTEYRRNIDYSGWTINPPLKTIRFYWKGNLTYDLMDVMNTFFPNANATSGPKIYLETNDLQIDLVFAEQNPANQETTETVTREYLQNSIRERDGTFLLGAGTLAAGFIITLIEEIKVETGKL